MVVVRPKEFINQKFQKFEGDAGEVNPCLNHSMRCYIDRES